MLGRDNSGCQRDADIHRNVHPHRGGHAGYPDGNADRNHWPILICNADGNEHPRYTDPDADRDADILGNRNAYPERHPQRDAYSHTHADANPKRHDRHAVGNRNTNREQHQHRDPHPHPHAHTHSGRHYRYAVSHADDNAHVSVARGNADADHNRLSVPVAACEQHPHRHPDAYADARSAAGRRQLR